MLVLTRHIDQGVRVFDVDGRYIAHIVVLGVERDRVKLGIEADPRFVVLRDELLGNNVEGAPAAFDVRNNGKAQQVAG